MKAIIRSEAKKQGLILFSQRLQPHGSGLAKIAAETNRLSDCDTLARYEKELKETIDADKKSRGLRASVSEEKKRLEAKLQVSICRYTDILIPEAGTDEKEPSLACLTCINISADRCIDVRKQAGT